MRAARVSAAHPASTNLVFWNDTRSAPKPDDFDIEVTAAGLIAAMTAAGLIAAMSAALQRWVADGGTPDLP